MPEQSKPKVLVIDDDKGLQTLVATLLQRAEMDPIVVGTASDAANELRRTPLPDVILLDLMLPDVSGIQFLHQIRAQPEYNSLPIIILSALADPDQIREGLQAGADRYLTKPYLANNLISTLQEVLQMGRNR